MDKIIELLQQHLWLGPLTVLLLVILGVAIGLPLGWYTAEFKPSTDDVMAVADSYSLNGNLDLAKARLAGLTPAEQERIINSLIRDRNARGLPIEAGRLSALAQALNMAVGPGLPGTPSPSVSPSRPSATPTPSSATSSLTSWLVPALIILVVIGIVIGAGWVFIKRILPGLRSARPLRTHPGEPDEQIEVERKRTAPSSTLQPTSTPGGPGRFIPSYALGQDNYDTSYSLDSPHGEFLGETGMGISETIGEGKPDKVTAFDLWLFDKADVRTVTQILMSEYAYKDQMLRTKLATKGEAFLAEKGKTLKLETQSLRIDAQIIELIYATTPNLPPNSHFQKLTVEIVPTLKEGTAATR